MENTVKVVIGSWGSYNECNERALGSNWLDLADYSDWDCIKEELVSEGFELEGIDEELFIQDIEGLPSDCRNWDYTNPQALFQTLLESDVLTDSHKYAVLMAFLEVRNFDDFEDRVSSHGTHWDDDIHIYSDYDWEDYGQEMFDCCGYAREIPEHLQDFFDFESYGRYLGSDCVEEYSGGLIEIYQEFAMEYKVGYYRFGRFKAMVVTSAYWSACDIVQEQMSKQSKRQWFIKPLSKREYARGVWRDCPF